ncbi:phytase [bacterium]|nr:phytase [bacterium]
MNLRFFIATFPLLIGLTLASCGDEGQTPPPAVVSETWISQPFIKANIDSVAFWPERKWILTTAKSTHEILVLDAQTGSPIMRFGEQGSNPGQFQRPNGIAVIDDYMFVVERDNHRVQALSLPDFKLICIFGENILKRPYGITLFQKKKKDSYKIYVTDNHMPNNPTESVLKERVKMFRVHFSGTKERCEYIKSFGSTEKKGALNKVESLCVDKKYNRLLIADERELLIKVYELDGNFTGQILDRNVFRFEPEGIDLYVHGDKGIWVIVDQKEEKSIFHLFNRVGLSHINSFKGKKVANTDGIVITPLGFPGFPEGGLFAVDDDTRVGSFSWKDIILSVLSGDGPGQL